MLLGELQSHQIVFTGLEVIPQKEIELLSERGNRCYHFSITKQFLNIWDSPDVIYINLILVSSKLFIGARPFEEVVSKIWSARKLTNFKKWFYRQDYVQEYVLIKDNTKFIMNKI